MTFLLRTTPNFLGRTPTSINRGRARFWKRRFGPWGNLESRNSPRFRADNGFMDGREVHPSAVHQKRNWIWKHFATSVWMKSPVKSPWVFGTAPSPKLHDIRLVPTHGVRFTAAVSFASPFWGLRKVHCHTGRGEEFRERGNDETHRIKESGCWKTLLLPAN